MNIEEIYLARWQRPSDFPFPDIFEHLPTLRRYAEQCSHITEFGTRTGNSTAAFLAGLAKNGGQLRCYDIAPLAFFPPPAPGVIMHFHQEDTGREGFQIAPTELLLIDSLHTRAHVLREFRQAQFVARWIIMHDTAMTWAQGIHGTFGVIEARDEFLSFNRDWFIREQWQNCNGLTVLERIA